MSDTIALPVEYVTDLVEFLLRHGHEKAANELADLLDEEDA